MHRKRWISPGLWENEEVLGLTDPALRVWVGTWSVSDRNGIFQWRPRKWTLRFAPGTMESAEEIFQQLLDAGLIEKFEADGEPYGFSVKWSKHQDPHIDEAPIYPMPSSPNFSPCPPRGWTKKNARWMVEVYGLVPSRDLKGTGGETSINMVANTGGATGAAPASASCPSCPSCPSDPSRPSGNKESSSELGEPALRMPDEDAILVLPCVGQGLREYPISRVMLQEWGEAFPGIDILTEARRMRLWLASSPKRQKTFNGMGRWILCWLSNAQNKPQTGTAAPVKGTAGTRFTRADQAYLDKMRMDHKENSNE